MELQPANVVYVLQFKAPGLGSNATLCVCSPHLAMIEKFISIHLEEDAKAHIESYAPQDLPPSILAKIHEYQLKYHKFSDNGSDEVFSIPTNRKIIEECTTMICSELSETCEFGDVITQTDIPIFDILNNLIGGLPYVTVLDIQKVNNDIDNNVDVNKYFTYAMMNTHYYGMDDKYTKSPDSLDDSYIWNELMTATMDGETDLVPFTAKAYVSCFTHFLFDPREWG